ncbi:hypothetical protein Anas_09772, partial [Armadillidium nasatum]
VIPLYLTCHFAKLNNFPSYLQSNIFFKTMTKQNFWPLVQPLHCFINSFRTANLQALRDSGALDNLCNKNGNSDALTNLLVYQYLSGSLPGTAGTHPGANVAAARAVAAAGSPHLQALLEGSMESKTKTSVTTTLTTRTITMDPSTKFTTSTTSYVTTITSLTSSILPIIFRGSKITTTITDRQTEVLTATEFITSSSVLTPSIIQTLNVEVTLTETSTKGLNGHYTLAQRLSYK